jgi:hypothetical protein
METSGRCVSTFMMIFNFKVLKGNQTWKLCGLAASGSSKPVIVDIPMNFCRILSVAVSIINYKLFYI